MARPLRIEYQDAWYHIMNRGLERRRIFLNNKHKKIFLDLLSEASELFKVEVHSYCLMSNHYHLLIRTKLPNLNLVMRHLNSIYTMRFNRDVKRDGPLFRGRYKSILVDKENYLLNVSRYIHKNPSTAKIVKDDQRYPWSSYQYFNLKKNRKPEWLTTSEVLNYFNGSSEEYISFVEQGVDENTIKFYSAENIKSILGKKLFIKEISDKFLKDSKAIKNKTNKDQIISVRYMSLDELLFKVVQKYKIETSLITKNYARNYVFERSLLIHLFALNPRYSAVEKGKFLGISGDAISKSNKRFLEKLKRDKKMEKEVELIRKEVYGEI